MKIKSMSNKNETVNELQDELDSIREASLLAPDIIRKKLIIWVIRNTLSVLLVWYFWDHWFMKYALWVIIPLSLFSLISIVGFNYFVKRKLSKTQSAVDILSDK